MPQTRKTPRINELQTNDRPRERMLNEGFRL